MTNAEIYLTDDEKRKVWDCVHTIEDRLNAITFELMNNKSYKGYIADKIEPICNDSEVIRRVCRNDKC